MKPLQIHYFQHVPFEGPGCITNWVTERGHLLTFTRFYEKHVLPDLSDIDWLIVMGGPMGVNDEDKYGWLKQEKDFIGQAIRANKTVIGICLGSQLIAEILDAKVYPNSYKEIGWYDVSLTKKGKENSLFEFFEPSFKVFHWHGDTYDLPNGAEHLLQSEGCRHQAFLYNNKVLGLQFHFEATHETLQEMIKHGKHELLPDKYIQTEEEILSNVEHILENNQKIYSILNKLVIN